MAPEMMENPGWLSPDVMENPTSCTTQHVRDPKVMDTLR